MSCRVLHRARRLLAGASDELYDLATIGLLEDVVHEADARGVKLTTHRARGEGQPGEEGVDRRREVHGAERRGRHDDVTRSDQHRRLSPRTAVKLRPPPAGSAPDSGPRA
jgi:hypothetical protein